MPTVIITDKQGTVVWTHETDNYRVRPEPETFLEVIRAI
jgi:beta-lactamase superfamily II metal-dependent hydrolase